MKLNVLNGIRLSDANKKFNTTGSKEYTFNTTRPSPCVKYQKSQPRDEIRRMRERDFKGYIFTILNCVEYKT